MHIFIKMAWEITTVNTKEKAEAYIIFKAFEVASTLNVPGNDFDMAEYESAKRFYVDSRDCLKRNYGANAIACDKAIEELERICLKGKTEKNNIK